MATYENLVNKENLQTFLTNIKANFYNKKEADKLLEVKASLESPALTGKPTAPTAGADDNTTQIATTEFVNIAINGKLAAAQAISYKGTIGTGGTISTLPATHEIGWLYVVATAGTYAGEVCEVGDLIICVSKGTTNKNTDWTVVQTNINGAVTGPASAKSANVAIFDGATGKIIKDSGFTIGASVPADAKFTDTIYTLPDATASVKGGVKVGSNITVANGTISVTSANVVGALGYTPLQSSDLPTISVCTNEDITALFAGI